MQEYIIRRILLTLLTLFGVATILFCIFRIMPGDPTAQVISPALDEVARARLKEAYGLDKPLLIQYILYLKNLATFEWGRSFTSSQKVFDILKYRFWNTIFLMGAAMCFVLIFGTGLGIIMAWRRQGIIDTGGTVTALIFQAAPPFCYRIIASDLAQLSARSLSYWGDAYTGGVYGLRFDRLFFLGFHLPSDFADIDCGLILYSHSHAHHAGFHARSNGQ
ncbi:MAG: ABC transporter permease [Spirochaetales bacterium]|nr:ABC transporter permease [Spirochaetales bacterium]